MRNLSFLLVFLPILTFIQAQNPLPTKIDSMLVEIDQSTFTSGVLYDRVFSWAQLDSFNDSLNISNQKHFEQSLLELYKSSNTEKFISHKTLRQFYSHDSLQNVIDIGVINASFHKVNYNANNESEGALRVLDEKFEKLNNSAPPFLEGHSLIATPLKLFGRGESFLFNFNENFLIQEAAGRNIDQLVVNFDTATDYILIQSGSIVLNQIPINYTEDGEKIITFTAIFEDGTQKTTQGIITINRIAIPPPDPLIVNNVTHADIPFQGYDEQAAIYGYLEYRTFYHTNNGNSQALLLKPIIIIDGFDPGDKRRIQDSDSHPGQTNIEHVSIEEMMSYVNNSGEKIYLIPQLRALGYDVVIVNHPNYWKNGEKIDGGADYIERNALTHVKLYQELNAQLLQNNSSEQLVIIGPSMGGQISRYALAYMEKNNIPHNTRLWVSIDSPHLGANIPVGAQTLLNVINDYSDSADAQDFVENQLGSAAAKQQLIEQHKTEYLPGLPFQSQQVGQQFLNGRTVAQGFSENRGHPFFVQYYNNLYNNRTTNTRGYPENLRKIALINGSLAGSTQFENPFVVNGVDESGTTFGDSYPGANAQTVKVKGSANVIGHITTLETYFMPDVNENHKIAFFKKKSLGGWNYFDRFITNTNSRGNMDNVPGGWFATQQQLVKSVTNSVPCDWIIGQICVNDWDVIGLKHINSFIPTISALGFFNPDFNWHERLNRNLACTNEIPFDSYFGPKINERHTSFTEESVAWLMEELAGNPQPPTVYLEGADMNGPAAVCVSGPATYDFDTCVSPPVESWEVSGNLQILTSDDTSVTVQAINGTVSGSGFIKAIYPYTEVKKTVWVGNPTQAPVITALTQNFPDSPVNYTFEIDPSISTVQGTVLEREWGIFPTYMVQIMNEDQVMITTPSNEGILLDYYYKFRNECGWSPQSEAHGQTVEDPNGDGGIESEVILFPNSSDQELHIDLRTTANDTYILDLYDQYANLLHHSECTNILKTIDTYSLDNGIYFLHISNGEELVIKQVVINH